MEWVASTLTPPPNVVYPALLQLMRTLRLPAVDWTDAHTDLNGLVRFGERWKLISARVSSHSARAIPVVANDIEGWGGGWGISMFISFFLVWRNSPQWARVSSFTRFLDHTQRRTTVSRTSLDELSARRRRDLYLTTHNTHNKQTSMPSVGFEPTISSGERPQLYVLDRVKLERGERFVGMGIFLFFLSHSVFTLPK